MTAISSQLQLDAIFRQKMVALQNSRLYCVAAKQRTKMQQANKANQGRHYGKQPHQKNTGICGRAICLLARSDDRENSPFFTPRVHDSLFLKFNQPIRYLEQTSDPEIPHRTEMSIAFA